MLEQLLKCGFMIIPLIVLSVFAAAIIIDRLRAYKVADEIDTQTLFTNICNNLEADNIAKAISACEESKGPTAAVLLTGLYRYQLLRERGTTRKEIERNVNKVMEEYAPQVREGLEKRLNMLLMIASVAPLLGMTGTVTGMIRSFDMMSGMGGLDAGAVAGGIAEALITTATGLIVAVPAVIFYYNFSRKVESYTVDLEKRASEMVDFIHLYADFDETVEYEEEGSEVDAHEYEEED